MEFKGLFLCHFIGNTRVTHAFLQDNAPPHRARTRHATKDWLNARNTAQLDRPHFARPFKFL